MPWVLGGMSRQGWGHCVCTNTIRVPFNWRAPYKRGFLACRHTCTFLFLFHPIMISRESCWNVLAPWGMLHHYFLRNILTCVSSWNPLHLTLPMLGLLSSKRKDFWKLISNLSCWYSLDSSCWALSDECPCARFSVIFQIFPSFCIS